MALRRRTSSKYDTLNESEDETQSIPENQIGFEILTSKCCTACEKSAIKLILDNFVTSQDLNNIISLNMEMLKEVEEHCKACNQNGKICKCRERQMNLVGNALQKLSFISLYGHPFTNELSRRKKENEDEAGSSKCCVVLSDASKETFKKLRRKFENIMKFYPHVYFSNENVIDQWTKSSALTRMREEVLNFDREKIAYMF